MSATSLVKTDENFGAVESALVQGNLNQLNNEQRLAYYQKVCESLGLNPLTQPFDYITLNGKLRLYAKKDATDQLRKINAVSIDKLEKEFRDDLYIVTAYASTVEGRHDISTGALVVGNLKGELLANALMKCETKAKRRVTLSICGLGFLDETEVETIREVAQPEVVMERAVPASEQPVMAEGLGAVESRMMTLSWTGKAVNMDEKVGSKAASSAKFQQMFVEKFNHGEHFRNHIIKHFGVNVASDLTWEQLQALYDHLNKVADDPRYYKPEGASVSGWEGAKAVQQLYIDRGLESLYDALHKHLETRLGSLDGQKVEKSLTDLLNAVGIAFSEKPTDAEIKEMYDALDKELK